VKVLDFGISKIENDDISDHRLTESAVLLGSPSYIAPEQMSDTRAVDARADVWGLGICAYELLTGHVPFKGSSVMDLAVRIAGDVVVPPSLLRTDVPPALDAIVLRCLEKDREARFASMPDLRLALLAAASPEVASELGASRTNASSCAIRVAAAIDPTGRTAAATENTETSDGLEEPEERSLAIIAKRTVPDPTPVPQTTLHPPRRPRARKGKSKHLTTALALLGISVLGAAAYAASYRREAAMPPALPVDRASLASATPESPASVSGAPPAVVVERPVPSAPVDSLSAAARSSSPARAIRPSRVLPTASTAPLPDPDAIPRTR